MRTAVVLVISWVVLAAVERWGEDASWSKAVLSGLLWAVVVTGVWWFAEWTQASRPRDMRRSELRRAKVDQGR
ncbi:hypothetical protein AB0D46_14285 [Streptomyces sp. NPDC048383]|uniref:hypothetical protein n=1 Tax=Streptomyces sp. NPDC048383 TaxID=3155386 RepID=UPI0034475B31